MGKKTRKKQELNTEAKKNSAGRNVRPGQRTAVKSAVFPFVITLLTVIALGIGFIFVGLSLQEKNSGTNRTEEVQETANSKFGPTTEVIPEQENILEKLFDQEENTANGSAESAMNDTVSGKYDTILADQTYMSENHIYSAETSIPGEVTFTFAGDILFDPGYSVMNTLRQNGYELSTCIAPEVLQKMQDADVMMLNNEFPFSDRGTPTEEKTFTFRAPTEYVKFLNEMGVDIVSLANNHAYDYGETALLDTFETLNGAGIPYVGAGHNKEEAQKTAYFIANDMKIAIVSATQIEKGDSPNTKGATEEHAGVFRCWNNKELLEQIRNAKENSDFVIAFIHWGTESQTETDWAQDEQAPQIAEAGADIIIGDHPHCLQKIGLVKGVPVVYSLGNFWFNSKALDTCLFSLTLDENGIKRMQFIPCTQTGCKTSLLEGGEKQRVIDFMNSISTGVTLDEDGFLNY